MAVLAGVVHAGALTALKSAPLAELGGEMITAEEVDKVLAAQLTKFHEQIYKLKRQKVEALLDAKVTFKLGLVTELEIEAFYQATIWQQIRTHFQNQKLAAHWETFLKTLRSHVTMAVHLKASPSFELR